MYMVPKPRVFALAAAGHRRRRTRSVDTRKLVDPFGIFMRNDSALGHWCMVRYRLIPTVPLSIARLLPASLKCQRGIIVLPFSSASSATRNLKAAVCRCRFLTIVPPP